MSADHRCKARGFGIQVNGIHIMNDVDVDARQLHDFGFVKLSAPRLMVNVAANRSDRRNLLKCWNNLWRADIACVNDVLGAA